ncbi:MAG: rRNA maturation RNase YbeY [Chitinophagaceae bacterium]
MAEIHFHSHLPVSWFRQRDRMRIAITDLFKREKKPLASLAVILVSDKELLSINKEFLNHDTYTDIITFNLSEGKECIGELYISVERVMANAGIFHVPKSQELRRVIFHGCLHLCGYKDKLKKDIQVIRQKEDEYLLRYLSK